MTTTSSTTSSTSTTSTTSSTNVASSITKTLGAGSGIDISTLVDELVTAQYDNTNKTLTSKQDTLTAQISAVSTLKSGITTFSSSLKTLINGGTLSTQPTSSNTDIVKVSTLQGSTVGKLSGTVEVRQLAAAQVASTATVASATTAIGTGKLTLTFGTATVSDGAMTAFTAGSAASVDIDITSDNNSLQGIADAINAKGAGVTATVLSDADGARLVLKSATGADQAFTLSATEDADSPGLSALAIGVGSTGTTITSTAQDAIVAVDGVAVRRSSNSIKDLISGVQLDLVSASVGTKVNLGTEAPTSALSQAVSDFVDAYNTLIGQLTTDTDPTSGTLKSDTAVQQLQRQLSRLTSTDLNASAGKDQPHTLASLGVSTNRDGTLTLDSDTLAKALLNYPDAVETMFTDSAGLSKALSDISTTASNTTYGLGASLTRYQKSQSDITDQQTKASDDADTMRTRLTQQFSSMDAKVASYKSTQDFLTQQVDAWNKSSS